MSPSPPRTPEPAEGHVRGSSSTSPPGSLISNLLSRPPELCTGRLERIPRTSALQSIPSCHTCSAVLVAPHCSLQFPELRMCFGKHLRVARLRCSPLRSRSSPSPCSTTSCATTALDRYGGCLVAALLLAFFALLNAHCRYVVAFWRPKRTHQSQHSTLHAAPGPKSGRGKSLMRPFWAPWFYTMWFYVLCTTGSKLPLLPLSRGLRALAVAIPQKPFLGYPFCILPRQSHKTSSHT